MTTEAYRALSTKVMESHTHFVQPLSQTPQTGAGPQFWNSSALLPWPLGSLAATAQPFTTDPSLELEPNLGHSLPPWTAQVALEVDLRWGPLAQSTSSCLAYLPYGLVSPASANWSQANVGSRGCFPGQAGAAAGQLAGVANGHVELGTPWAQPPDS